MFPQVFFHAENFFWLLVEIFDVDRDMSYLASAVPPAFLP